MVTGSSAWIFSGTRLLFKVFALLFFLVLLSLVCRVHLTEHVAQLGLLSLMLYLRVNLPSCCAPYCPVQ